MQQTFEGMWDEMAKTLAGRLRGRRVSIKVLETREEKRSFNVESFDASMARLAALTAGKPKLPWRLLTAEDFYESAE
jgi:hypothetical protein